MKIDIQWLLSRIEKVDSTGCWEWKLTKERAPLLPYGRAYFGKGYRLAHRVAYEIANGFITKRLCVCHKCDNPPCCNPEHLFLGTAVDNVMDRVKKGRTASGARSGRYTKPERAARGDRHGSKTKPHCVLRGEFHGRSKLNFELAKGVLEDIKGGMSYKMAASKYGVGKSTICRVMSGESWKNKEVAHV